MRASDIVLQLVKYLPQLVDDFTDTFSVLSLTRSGTTVTAQTSVAHNLIVGNQANIKGAQTPIVISSLTRSGEVGTMVTAADHDIVFGDLITEVELSGAVEAEFNGSFLITGVQNRRTITFEMTDSGPTTATGSPLLLNGSGIAQSYNGIQEVTAVPTADTFEFEVEDLGQYSPASGTITAKSNPRISSAIDIDRVLESYTKQPDGDAWGFVVLGDSLADKDRNLNTDGIANIQSTKQYFNQRYVQTFTFYVLIPTTSEIGGSNARDRCEELLRPICQCLLGVKLPSLLGNTFNNPIMLSGHAAQAYNSAFYVHAYNFEATLQMSDQDIFIPTEDVAFRDIQLVQGFDFGTGTIESDIDLDEEPLP